MRGTKEEIVDIDIFLIFLSGCELGYLFVAGLCVFEIGGVAWCDLIHGSYKNNYLFGFF